MNSTSNPFNVKLRKVPGPSPSQRPKNEWKVNSKPLPTNNDGPPFALLRNDNPKLLFGVVLRPVRTTAATSRKSEVGEEGYLDLDFDGGERPDGPAAFAQEGSAEKETSGFPFGVRLKPTLRPYEQHGLNRTYQIDLNPPPLKAGSKNDNNTYHHSRPLSLLEIKLRPVDERDDDNENKAAAAEFVMLQLRHVVAPPDGGPKRAVNEALLQIPLLRKVGRVPKRSSRNNDNPLQCLLQLAIQSLKHVTPNQQKASSSELLQIRLRHVDPETQQTHDMTEAIELAFMNPASQQQKSTKGLSMQVTLRRVQPNNNSRTDEEGSFSQEFANIQLKSVHCREVEEEEVIDDDDGHNDDDDDDDDKDGNTSKKDDHRHVYPEKDDDNSISTSEENIDHASKGEDHHIASEKVEESRISISEGNDDHAAAAANDEEDDDDQDSNTAKGGERKEQQSLAECIEAADINSAAEEEDVEGKLQSSLPKIEQHQDILPSTALKEEDEQALRHKVSRPDILPSTALNGDDEQALRRKVSRPDILPSTSLLNEDDEQALRRKVSRPDILPADDGPAHNNSVTTTTPPLKDDDEQAFRRKVSRPAAPQRQRSRSLNDIHSVARTTTEKDKEASGLLSEPKRRDLLLWYHRLKAPTKEEMKRRVAQLPKTCDITPDDVELLPWRCNGRFLDVRTMNRYFLEDWQGAKQQKSSDDDDEKGRSDCTSDSDTD